MCFIFLIKRQQLTQFNHNANNQQSKIQKKTKKLKINGSGLNSAGRSLCKGSTASLELATQCLELLVVFQGSKPSSGRSNGRTYGRTAERTEGRTVRRSCARKVVRTDGGAGGQTDGRAHARTNGRTVGRSRGRKDIRATDRCSDGRTSIRAAIN